MFAQPAALMTSVKFNPNIIGYNRQEFKSAISARPFRASCGSRDERRICGMPRLSVKMIRKRAKPPGSRLHRFTVGEYEAMGGLLEHARVELIDGQVIVRIEIKACTIRLVTPGP